MKTPFDSHRGLSCICRGSIEDCGCSDGEMALRHYARSYTMPPMTVEQREWCIRQIDRVEGFEGANYERATDSELGGAVLEVWLEYCRDKGLYR
jgi:hypothetical protein